MNHHMGESADTINKEMVPQVGEMQEILEYRKTKLLQIIREQYPVTKVVNLNTVENLRNVFKNIIEI